jgi:hypothetical protein
MPLIDLKTNLKSLKYGNDQPGGGSSGLPYIQTKMPPTNLITLAGPGNTNPIFRPTSTGNSDFPIRGGDIDFNIGTQTFTISSKVDKERIKKFMKDPKRGTIFLNKQIGLNLSNPKIETGNSFQVVPGSNIIPGLIENTRIYNNGINTLTQIGVQGTGTHLPRQGVFPLDYASKYYKDIVGAQSLLNSTEVIKINRLLILQNLKLNTSSTSANLGNINQINKLGISLNRNTLFKYLGGPGSTYGIGTTTIKRVDDTSQAAKKFVGQYSMTYDNIFAQNINNTDRKTGKRTTNIQDYKTKENIKTREEFYNLNISGKDNPKRTPDQMNMLKSFLFDNNVAPWEIKKEGTKDIVKFVFEAIENNRPSTSWAIFFRAMINGFSDSHQASINSFKYQGRGEDFYTYQGVSRNISFGFKIAVESSTELQPLYTKLNHLVSQVYPDYSPTYGVMRAPMIRLTIGDYLYRIAGMLENVNITIDDNAPWDINYFENTKQLPQIINVQCTFKPIQDFVPRRVNDANINVPFMTNSEEDYLSLEGYNRIIDPAKLMRVITEPATSRDRNPIQNMASTETSTGTIPVTVSSLKYDPIKKPKLFESQLEKDLRTGNFFEVFRSDRG